MSSILFVSAPYHCGVVEVAGTWIPLHFCYLADAAARAGVKPTIYDAMSLGVTHDDILSAVEAEKPDYLALSAITPTLPDNLEIAQNVRKIAPETTIILGGVHPTFAPEEIFARSSGVDIIVRGEGEETLYELLSCLEKGEDPEGIPGLALPGGKEGGFHLTPPRPFMGDLEVFSPRFDLLSWERYSYYVIPDSRLGAIASSRGCSHDCSFCSQQKFWHQTWRGRAPGRVVEEIRTLNENHGVNVILFTDEYPTSDRDRWVELLERIVALKKENLYFLIETRVDDILRDADILSLYRRAGIIHVYVGVEAVSQEMLDYIKKDVKVEAGREALRLLREHDFISETSFVLGFPTETKESIRRTLALAEHYNPDFAHFLAITPWPYAEIYEEMLPHIAVKDYRRYNLIDPIVKPTAMTLEEVDEAIIECYRKFYMGKFRSVGKEKDPFRRDYLKRSMLLIMQSSFIVEKLKRYPRWHRRIEEMMRRSAI